MNHEAVNWRRYLNAAASWNARRADVPTSRPRVLCSGASPILTPHQQREARKKRTGETQRSVARSYNVSQATISRLMG
jgi:hypothetical protein